ncbi:hypothetical protein A6395_05660 [Exiguobacterium sp. SH31]|uniref:aldose epimerase family protein n=1 Tax=Exiguobacterium sp. SH31 TaxID=1843183 RepID=UPI0008C9FCC0|nr:aldose epimerase family protein [Exiguobacterium sp. SH31]OGX79611.1 hypothetical protein A6395_05660 [Exiguobacterium sp. SH31]
MYFSEKSVNGLTEFTLLHPNGLSLKALNRGGILTHLFVPDRSGTMENVLLTYENYNQYMDDPNYMGALIGRVAGRIRDARYKTGNTVHQLEANTRNQLHGGNGGLHQVMFEVTPFEDSDDVGLRLQGLLSNESGHVGTVKVIIEYRLTDTHEFIIRYNATVSERTPLTLTNHAYFNLSGNAREAIHCHELEFDASTYIELDERLLPTGRINDVTDTPFDLRKSKRLACVLSHDTQQQQFASGGIDHYFLFDTKSSPHVTLTHRKSGRRLQMTTTYPGFVLYTGNSLSAETPLATGPNAAHMGICLETQHPAAALEMEQLPPIWCTPTQPYIHQTVYRFDTI